MQDIAGDRVSVNIYLYFIMYCAVFGHDRRNVKTIRVGGWRARLRACVHARVAKGSRGWPGRVRTCVRCVVDTRLWIKGSWGGLGGLCPTYGENRFTAPQKNGTPTLTGACLYRKFDRTCLIEN